MKKCKDCKYLAIKIMGIPKTDGFIDMPVNFCRRFPGETRIPGNNIEKWWCGEYKKKLTTDNRKEK